MEGMSHGLEWWISGDNHLNGEDVTSVKEKETIEGEGLSTSRLTLVPFFFFFAFVSPLALSFSIFFIFFASHHWIIVYSLLWSYRRKE